MVSLPQTYNTTDLPDTGGGIVLIPPGQYQAVIVESDLKPSKTGGQFLALKVIITQGQYANTEFVERLNIINSNTQAVEIAYKTLARISEALGMTKTPEDSDQLHNRPLIIQVETESGKPYSDSNGNQREGKDKSVIKKYLPLVGVSVSGSPFGVPVQGAQTLVQASAPPIVNPFAPPQN